jgi:hypothetical protein
MRHTEIEDIVTRIRGEYIEMPGLSLTASQARRLWNLSDEGCRSALDALMEERFLLRTDKGAFIRHDHSFPGRALIRRRA